MLYKLRCALARFQYGRNGVDALARASLVVILALDVLVLLLARRHTAASTVLYWLTMAGWAWMIFRIYSKNLPKRRAENQWYLTHTWKLRSAAAGAKARRADRDHKYFTCKCGAICRVPVGKGKIVITCPKCGEQFQGKT